MSGNGVQEKFEPGDVVYLKSGSPPLTVEEVDESGATKILVRWYAGGEMGQATFPIVCLTKERHWSYDIPPRTEYQKKPNPKRKQNFDE